MIWFLFFVGCFAAHNISLAISKEDGPGWMFWKIRMAPPKGSSAREGLSCQWCMSRYAAAPIAILIFHSVDMWWLWLPVIWLAISTGAIIINQAFTK